MSAHIRANRNATIIVQDSGYTAVCPQCGVTSARNPKLIGYPRDLVLQRCAAHPVLKLDKTPKSNRKNSR